MMNDKKHYAPLEIVLVKMTEDVVRTSTVVEPTGETDPFVNDIYFTMGA